jgi:hypothetical protein
MAPHEIVKEKYLGIAAVFDGFGGFKYVIIKAAANKIDRQEH